MNCDFCCHNVYDEDEGDYICDIDMDEDEWYRLLASGRRECPYFAYEEEYHIVRHQI